MWQRTNVRKADRNRASGPPSSSEGRSPNSSTRRRIYLQREAGWHRRQRARGERERRLAKWVNKTVA